MTDMAIDQELPAKVTHSSLIGLTLQELQSIAIKAEQPEFAARQLARWLYKSACSSVGEMTDLSRAFRSYLEEHYTAQGLAPIKTQQSYDEVTKYLFPVNNDLAIEAVFIPESTWATLCISSQIGCKYRCSFCKTGTMGFLGQASAFDIINQYHSIPMRNRVDNIVFMGMGEPLDNMDAVMASIMIFTAPWGYAMSPRRITVSTVGIVPQLSTLIENTECNIALSVHSAFDEERASLMPVQNVHPLKSVLGVFKKHPFVGQRRLMIEYVMLRGINDSAGHFKQLIRCLNDIPCSVNLIPYHAMLEAPFLPSPNETIDERARQLGEAGITCTVRKSRGNSIMAACGQLATAVKAP